MLEAGKSTLNWSAENWSHSRYYSLISPSLTPLLSSSSALVSGSVNRNWQANTWEHSKLLFDVCTDSYLWLFCGNCAQGTALGTENTILCVLNLMELQSVQLFAKLEVAVAWLEFVTFPAQCSWHDHTSRLETSFCCPRTTIFMHTWHFPYAKSSHEMVQTGIAIFLFNASWLIQYIELIFST